MARRRCDESANIDADRVTLEWPEAKDNVGVTKYLIFRDKKQIKEIPRSIRAYEDTGLKLGQADWYAVCAQDAAGNKSAGLQLLTPVTTHDTSAPTWPVGGTVYAMYVDADRVTWNGRKRRTMWESRNLIFRDKKQIKEVLDQFEPMRTRD